ncbi:MAG: methylmalonyl-CoA mutase [Chloroflexi bacterium]|nr:methylmalonyl-CoA mutase [Chloroflexota bacterium]
MDRDEMSQIELSVADWEQNVLRRTLQKSPKNVVGPPPEVETNRLYTPLDLKGHNYLEEIGLPGEYPYTRGIHATMFRGKLWTMRQYAGFGTAEDTNIRFKRLVDEGQTGLAVATDLPTQLGYDSDHPEVAGEVGVIGMACPTIREMEIAFRGIPQDKVTIVPAINSLASVFLAMYVALARGNGIPTSSLGGTSSLDILQEYTCRGTYIFPPAPSIRLIVDLIEYCVKEIPKWNFMLSQPYSYRESGASLIQEVAFGMATAAAIIDKAVERGLDVDSFAPRINVNFSVHTNIFEEAAKFRAARRMWARMMKERYGAQHPNSLTLRASAGTGATTMTAQQPENNVVRVAIECLAAVLGGVQSLHTTSMDEALAIPTEKSATLALRTQQIVAYESGAAEVVDPLGGSYYVEALTNRIEEEAASYVRRIEEQGGMLRAVETGWVQRQLADESYRRQMMLETGQRTLVGVNKYATGEPIAIKLHRAKSEVVEMMRVRLDTLRRERDNAAVEASLVSIRTAASGNENLVPLFVEAASNLATIGEITAALKTVFGEHRADLASIF